MNILLSYLVLKTNSDIKVNIWFIISLKLSKFTIPSRMKSGIYIVVRPRVPFYAIVIN